MNNQRKTTDNYQELCRIWRQKFLTWNHKYIYENLQLKGYGEDTLTITYLGTPYSIDRHTGLITNQRQPAQTISFNTYMAIFHLFYYAKENPKNSGEWIPFRQVKRAGGFDSAFTRLVRQPFAEAFSGRLPLLLQTGQALSFPRLSYGDASFYVEAFSCIPMQFIFWDGDEEFPAQLNILFDANITDFTHEETVVLMAQDAAKLFLETAKTISS